MEPECGNAECELCVKRAKGETCQPDCAGWYIDLKDGRIQRCDVCLLHEDDEAAATVARDLVEGHLPGPRPPIVLGDEACERCGVEPIPDFPIGHSNHIAEEMGVLLCMPCANFAETFHARDVLENPQKLIELWHEDHKLGGFCCETCRGWDVFDAGGVFEIERCDDCGVFKHDDDAWPVAIAFYESLLPGKKIGRTTDAEATTAAQL